MRFALNGRLLVAFAALIVLCGLGHEFAHHVVGAAACGAFGYKTFNSFELLKGCEERPWSFLATVAGPVFTFALMWLGWAELRRPEPSRRQLGFALIFANFPVNRMFFALIGYNDEQWVARHLYGSSRVAFWVTVLLIWAICLPPLVAAYRAIRNPWRPLWFAGFFVLPFAYVVGFAGLFLENYLLLGRHVLASTVWGIPYLILVTEAVALLVYLAFRTDLAGADASDLAGARHVAQFAVRA
jgi:hypothetical protein